VESGGISVQCRSSTLTAAGLLLCVSVITTIHPTSGTAIEPSTAIAAEHRPAGTDRPWICTNMISSLDGATAVDGLSGGLGAPADLDVFLSLRGIADAVLVGSTTAKTEHYKPPMPSDAVVDMRRRRNQADRPVIVVITQRLSITPDAPLFSDPSYRPVLVTSSDASPPHAGALESVADVVRTGPGDVDLGIALRELRQRGLAVALLEGGPTLNGAFIAADLIDEWNLTTSPVLVGGPSDRPARSAEVGIPHPFNLDRIWTGDELLFSRWLRTKR
jgi:riboflavin biosynthesis pyrimidine reductase